jgi:hypothetical protein
MKPISRLNLLWLSASLLSLPTISHAQWKYTTNCDNTIAITKLYGTNGAVVMPNTINGLPITSVENFTFAGCDCLTNVCFPCSVTNIGSAAFFDCPNLSSITVDSANSTYSSVDGILFNKNQTSIILCPKGKDDIENYTIPSSVRKIEHHAFEGCRNLRAVTLPQGLTDIEQSAFGGCSLICVIIPDSVTNIGWAAFQDCPLTDVTLGTNVIEIGRTAFNCCPFATITIPASVTNIGEYAFYGCYRLTAITVDGKNAFYSSLDGVLFDKKQKQLIHYPAKKSGHYIIPTGVTCIGNDAFLSPRLTGVTIPNSVTNIGDSAFSWCRLTSVTIPDSVIQIGADAFSGCPLKNVTIPDSVTRINRGAFKDCKSLTHVTVGKNVTAIEKWGVFNNCTNLTTVLFKGNAPKLVLPWFSPQPINPSLFDHSDKATVYYVPGTKGWSKKFSGRPTAVWTNTLPAEKMLGVPDELDLRYLDFTWTSNGKTVVINGYEGTNTVVTIPETLDGLPITGIEWDSFSEVTTNLFAVKIPKSITSIGPFRCRQLAGITIPDSVTNIGDSAFFNCENLASVTIPNSVAHIGKNAFCGCIRFSGITIPDSVTSIGAYSFCNCTNLTSVTLSKNVTNIGESSFYDCGITYVMIPASVTYIGCAAFYYCRQLAGVYFMGDAPHLGDGVFNWDEKATIYYLPGTTGWSHSFGGRPTAVWNPPPQTNAVSK